MLSPSLPKQGPLHRQLTSVRILQLFPAPQILSERLVTRSNCRGVRQPHRSADPRTAATAAHRLWGQEPDGAHPEPPVSDPGHRGGTSRSSCKLLPRPALEGPRAGQQYRVAPLRLPCRAQLIGMQPLSLPAAKPHPSPLEAGSRAGANRIFMRRGKSSAALPADRGSLLFPFFTPTPHPPSKLLPLSLPPF